MRFSHLVALLLPLTALALPPLDAQDPSFTGCAPDPDFRLTATPNPIQSGSMFTLELTGGSPDALTYLVYAIDDAYTCAIFKSEYQVCINMCGARRVWDMHVTDSAGTTTWNLLAPAALIDHRLRFQALQYGKGSYPLDLIIQP